MENATQEPYRDSPASSRSSSPVSSDGRLSTAKLLPTLPNNAPPPFEEAYRDAPSPVPRSERYHSTSDAHTLDPQAQLHYTPYTDFPDNGDDDVPLAYLYRYPTEAPPAYHVVVRQSYRNTLIAHIPTNFTGSEADEEEGGEREMVDNVRFSIERVVAGLIVSIVLLLISCVLVWSMIGS